MNIPDTLMCVDNSVVAIIKSWSSYEIALKVKDMRFVWVHTGISLDSYISGRVIIRHRLLSHTCCLLDFGSEQRSSYPIKTQRTLLEVDQRSLTQLELVVSDRQTKIQVMLKNFATSERETGAGHHNIH